MYRFAGSTLLLALTMMARTADAQALQERFERAEKGLIESGTNAAHMNSIKLIAQLIARDRMCPPDDRMKGYLAFETAVQARDTGLTKETIVAKADALVPMYIEYLSTDPVEKKLACEP